MLSFPASWKEIITPTEHAVLRLHFSCVNSLRDVEGLLGACQYSRNCWSQCWHTISCAKKVFVQFLRFCSSLASPLSYFRSFRKCMWFCKNAIKRRDRLHDHLGHVFLLYMTATIKYEKWLRCTLYEVSRRSHLTTWLSLLLISLWLPACVFKGDSC